MGTPKHVSISVKANQKKKKKRWHQTLQDASARTGSLHRQRNIVHYNGKRGSTPLYIQNGARRDDDDAARSLWVGRSMGTSFVFFSFIARRRSSVRTDPVLPALPVHQSKEEKHVRYGSVRNPNQPPRWSSVPRCFFSIRYSAAIYA